MRAEHLRRAIKFGPATTSQEDGCAFCHKPFSFREPNPGTTAGDDGHLVFKPSTHEGSPYPRLIARTATHRGAPTNRSTTEGEAISLVVAASIVHSLDPQIGQEPSQAPIADR